MRQLPFVLTALYCRHLDYAPVPEPIFLKLMHIAIECVQFSFNNAMYQQVDRIAMGSSLGVVLANIFVMFQEERLFKTTNKPLFYNQYVDDAFVIFPPDQKSDVFSLQSTNYIQCWNLLVNLITTTAFLFLMSLLSTPMLAYRLLFIINPCLLVHTHSGGYFAPLDAKLI